MKAATLTTCALAALLTLPTHATAQSWFTNNFIDPEDGALDVSPWLEKGGFLPVPLIITEPAVDNGLGIAAAFIHGDLDNPEAQPNITGVAALATGNDSKLAAGFHLGSYLDNRLRYAGAIATTSINLTFYGPGGVLDDGFGYNIDGSFILNNARYRLGQSDFWLGGRWQLLNSKVSFDDGSLPPGVKPDQLDATLSNLAATLYYDSRDNIFTPTQGVFARGLIGRDDNAWGSDFDFNSYELTAMGYRPLGERWDFSLLGSLEATDGDTPFFVEPFIKLRGIPALRYQGTAVAETEIEARYSLTDRWSVLGFTGVGFAADGFDKLGDSKGRAVYGGGFRYLVARSFGIHAGLDVAQGPEDTVVYLQVGHAWQRD